MKRLLLTLLTVLTLLVLLLPVAAVQASASDRPNFLVFRDVSRQVNGYAWFTIFDSVHVGLDAGVVTLTGKVTMPFKADEIAKRVARVHGVRAVRNRLEVLPVSQFDTGLRMGLARALFAHPALAQYALGANPPIHIIVERGRITLDGVVNSHADRLIATAVARSFTSFGVTNNLKTDEEVTAELERL